MAKLGCTLRAKDPQDQPGQRAQISYLAFFALVITYACELHSSVNIFYRKLDIKAFYCYDAFWPVGVEFPSIIFSVVDFYTDTLRVNHDVVLYCRAFLIICEFFNFVDSFCAR